MFVFFGQAAPSLLVDAERMGQDWPQRMEQIPGEGQERQLRGEKDEVEDLLLISHGTTLSDAILFSPILLLGPSPSPLRIPLAPSSLQLLLAASQHGRQSVSSSAVFPALFILSHGSSLKAPGCHISQSSYGTLGATILGAHVSWQLA